MTDPIAPRPVLRLKPKADARRYRRGAPWAWADDLVLDRRARALAPGSLAELQDAERRPLGMGVATTGAKIALRLLDRDPAAQIDAEWFTTRIRAARTLRETIYPTPHYRLIHAEGDDLPGLIVDRFGPCLVVQPNAIWLEERLETITSVLAQETGAEAILKNGTARARAAEGLPAETGVLLGQAPQAPLTVPMNGALYRADVVSGQKTGLFFDQRENQRFAQRLAPGARVLDVFSHVGGFGLACLAAGAAELACVDASSAALDLAQQGAEAMGAAERLTLCPGDAFEVMANLAADHRVFELVIADPPAFAPNRAALDKGLRAYERVARMAARLVAPGGVVILCSCSHAADLARFRAACLAGIGKAGRRARLLHTGFAGPDHPQHPDLTETGYLQALAFRLVP